MPRAPLATSTFIAPQSLRCAGARSPGVAASRSAGQNASICARAAASVTPSASLPVAPTHRDVPSITLRSEVSIRGNRRDWDRHIVLDRHTETLEAARRDADDCKGQAFGPDGPADDRRIPAEVPLPEPPADDRHRLRVDGLAVFTLPGQSLPRRAVAPSSPVVARHARDAGPKRAVRRLDCNCPLTDRTQHGGERALAARQLAKLPPRQVAFPSEGSRRGDLNQLLRTRHRQRPQHQGAQQAEDGSTAPAATREDDDRGDREGGGAAKAAKVNRSVCIGVWLLPHLGARSRRRTTPSGAGPSGSRCRARSSARRACPARRTRRPPSAGSGRRGGSSTADARSRTSSGRPAAWPSTPGSAARSRCRGCWWPRRGSGSAARRGSRGRWPAAGTGRPTASRRARR